MFFPELAEIIERWLAFQDARRVFSGQSLLVTSAGGASLSEAPTISIAPVIGHSSARATENSYALSSKEGAARQLFLAAGEGPFSLAASLSDLSEMMSSAGDVAAADPQAALVELRRLQKLASDLERSLVRVVPELNRLADSAAPTVEA